MDADYTRNIPTLTSAARATSSGARSASVGNGARLGAIDLMTMSTFSPLNYGQSGAGFMFGATSGGNWFQCPVNVPFCEREACVNPSYDQMGSNTNAFACYTQPGCCFDQVLYQHRLAFGQNFFKT